jgi:DNA-binding cell septation regulator SpoVG
MKITIEMKRVSTDTENAFRATANIVLDGVFIIRNARLIHTARTFMAMPSLTGRSGFRFNACHPITNDFRLEMENAFIMAYHNYLAENNLNDPDAGDDREPEA